jgi:hypothetical protein
MSRSVRSQRRCSLLPMELWIEQRQHVRQVANAEGTAVANEGLLRVPVRVLNLSSASAMVQLPVGAELPERIVLLFNHSIESCRRTWLEDIPGMPPRSKTGAIPLTHAPATQCRASLYVVEKPLKPLGRFSRHANCPQSNGQTATFRLWMR